MIKYQIADKKNIEQVLSARYETIRAVCGLQADYVFSHDFQNITRKYFENAEQTTVLAFDNDKAVGCATVCYIELMPTFEHPTGKRGHIMNVYTAPDHRRQGIGYNMMSMLIKDAEKNGVTELSLDATADGRMLYEKCGFKASEEGMVLVLKGNAQ